MILYFSGTGNSLAVARKIADTCHDRIVDLGRANKIGKLTFYVEQGENLGFVFPTYVWSTPRIIDSVLREANFFTDNRNPYTPGYCYCVITCGGGFVGDTARFFDTMLRKYQGLKLDAAYSVKCVGNCVSLYGPPTGVKLREILQESDVQATEIAERIASKKMGFQEKRNPFGRLMSKASCREDKQNDIVSFHVDERLCNGCGICAAICPTNTIEMVGGLPIWSGTECTQCYACLHRCPQKASQFGPKTAQRGRFVNQSLKNADLRDPRQIPAID